MHHDSFFPKSSDVPSLELTVVMPCYNEALQIEPLLREWSSLLQVEVPSFEIVVINDGSKDGTGRILDRLRKEMRHLRVIHQLNLGAARAVRRGIESARGKYIATLSADGSIEPAEFLDLWNERFEHHLVIAKRVRRLEGMVPEFFARSLVRATHLLFSSKLTDPASPFRLFRRDAALPVLHDLPPTSHIPYLGLAIKMENLYPAQIKEVAIPIRVRETLRRRTSLLARFWSSVQISWDLITLRILDFRKASPLLSQQTTETLPR